MREWEQAFRAFVAVRGPELQRAAYLMTGDWQLAEDLAQTTLTDAYVHWRKVERADNPTAYVHRMLTNNVRSTWRRRSHHERPSDDLEGREHVQDHADAVVGRDELVTALLALPPKRRAAVVLRHVVGLSERDTAESLGVSVGTVKSQTARGLASLRAALREEAHR